MKTVSPDLFGLPFWTWFLVPLFCLQLIRVLDRGQGLRGSGVGLITTSLALFAAVALTRWQHFI